MEHTGNIEEKFVMPARLKMWSFILIIVGLVGIAASFFMYSSEEGTKHVWASLILMSTYFQGITMSSAFFLAATYVAYGGWQTALRRVPEAIAMVLPVTGLFLLLILVIPNLIYGYHPVYEWTNKAVAESDPVIQAKTPYLNLPFFFIRFAFFVGGLTLLAYLMRRNSLMEDQHSDLKYYRGNLKWGSIFLVIFAVYILVMNWDWLMSIDAHWYSTMYGWYAFASNWVNGIAVITLVIIYLKNKGYLSYVNNSHLHMLGMMMFAFSIFWTYVTFDQFMLIWYANIPEETEYFRMRYDHFMWLFYAIWIINFLLPFLVLMSRDAKRKIRVMTTAAIIIIIGHFVDYYLMVYPATIHAPQFGLIEVSSLMFFAGVFIYTVFTNLGKANLVPKHDPFLQESLHHST